MLRQSKVQSFSRPLLSVAESEDAGAIGLEKFIASLLGCAIQNLSTCLMARCHRYLAAFATP